MFMNSSSLLWKNIYFLSENLILNADNSLSNVKSFIPSKPSNLKYTIYAYKPGDLVPLIFESQNKCIKNLGGTHKTLIEALKGTKLFKGYIVSRQPITF
jgi:hypothetical protein